jgi:hypothetical protein
MRTIAERVLLPLGIDGALLVAICMFYANAPLLTGLVAALFCFTLLFRFSQSKVRLAALATLFGAGGELLCTAPGINLWVYEHPSFWNIPAWLPLIWPILLITFTDMATFVHQQLAVRVRERTYWFIVRLSQAVAAAYALYTFARIQWVIASVFLVFFVLLFLYARQPDRIVLFWVAAVGGSVGEYLCIRSGVWHYTRPFFAEFGVPLSLPLAWGLSANIILLLARMSLQRSCAHKPG